MYTRVRQLEQTYPRDAGGYIINAARVVFGWGDIRDEDWPDATVYGPEPEGLDSLAKAFRSQLYFRVQDLREVRLCLMAHCPVAAAFPVTHDWFTAPEGGISRPIADAPIIGTHAVSIHVYSDTDRRLTFANSWGREWGNSGFGTLTYDFFDSHVQEAWAMAFPRPGAESAKGELHPGLNVLNWGQPCPIGFIHGIEIYDADADERQAWSLLSERKDRLEVVDLFVKPAHRSRGVAKRLVDRILELRALLRLPLMGLVHPIDARMFQPAIEKLTMRLGLVLTDGRRPWARFIARETPARGRDSRRRR